MDPTIVSLIKLRAATGIDAKALIESNTGKK